MFILTPKIKRRIISGILIGYVILTVLFLQLPDKNFHVYFLDVGQGDSIFIKTPQNHQVLIDGGPADAVIERLGEIMPFFDKSIDMVVLTHPHSDHVDGLVEVLKRYDVENVLLTGVSDDYPGYLEFLKEIDEKNIKVFIADDNTDFLLGDVLIDTIYPFKNIFGEWFLNLNNSSIAVRVIYKNNVMLLAGDLEAEAEKELIASKIDLKADILKASHHGSKTASSLLFLEKVRPETVVIQCGAENKFGHPHPETLKSLEKINVKKIFRNDLDGTVEFVF